jgi:hypothetical protein
MPWLVHSRSYVGSAIPWETGLDAGDVWKTGSRAAGTSIDALSLTLRRISIFSVALLLR